MLDQRISFGSCYIGSSGTVTKSYGDVQKMFNILNHAASAITINIIPNPIIQKTTVDQLSQAGQKTLYVNSTSGWAVDDSVTLNRNEARYELGKVATITDGVSLNLVDNLTYAHAPVIASNETVDQITPRNSVNGDSSSGQKVLQIDLASGSEGDWVAGDKVLIGRGTAREEIGEVDTIQAGISITLLANLTYTHAAVDGDLVDLFIPDKTTVDAESLAGQKVLSVAATTGFAITDFAYINYGEWNAEIIEIDTIQAGISLTGVSNMTYSHFAAKNADQVEKTNSFNCPASKDLLNIDPGNFKDAIITSTGAYTWNVGN